MTSQDLKVGSVFLWMVYSTRSAVALEMRVTEANEESVKDHNGIWRKRSSITMIKSIESFKHQVRCIA